MANKIPGCFKYGCIGCGSLLAILFGLIFLLSAIQLTADHEPDPVERRAEQPLPAPPPMPGLPPEAPPNVPGTDVPATVTIQRSDELHGAEVAAGTLVLDLEMGDFTIRPGPADEPIRVLADFDAASFELDEAYSEGADGNWTYEVGFGARGGFFGMLMRGGGNSRNDVEIIIPRGHPIRILGKMAMGESKVDLGGLWIDEVDLELGTGDHFIEFREPLPFPMRSFRIDSSMGGVEVRSLGNASPADVVVAHGMGDMFLDLEGAWRNDADIEASFRMGQCRVWLPATAKVEIEGGNVSMGEAHTEHPDPATLPADAPTLRLHVSGSMGDLRIER